MSPDTARRITRAMAIDMNRDLRFAEALTALGLVPGSTELHAMEHRESVEREHAVALLDPHLRELCPLAAEAVTRTILGHRGDPEDLLDGLLPYLIEHALRAVLGHLLPNGHISTP